MYKVRDGEDVTFTVRVSGLPKPEAEWYKSKTVLKKSPQIIKTSTDESASLTLKKVTEQDVGEYTIKIKNPSGEAEANLTLIIISKLIIRKTRM